MLGEIHHPALDRGEWKILLFFPVCILWELQRSQCVVLLFPGSWQHSAGVFAVLWACASVWTPVLWHPCVFSIAPMLNLACHPHCQPWLLLSCPNEGCFQEKSPTSRHPWATLHSPGGLADSVWAVSKTAIWLWADFTNLCVVIQREVVGCSQGWMSHPSCCHLVCKYCGIVLCALGVCDQCGASQLLWEQKKKHNNILTTQTQNRTIFFGAFGAFQIDEDVAAKNFQLLLTPMWLFPLQFCAHVCSIPLSWFTYTLSRSRAGTERQHKHQPTICCS